MASFGLDHYPIGWDDVKTKAGHMCGDVHQCSVFKIPFITLFNIKLVIFIALQNFPCQHFLTVICPPLKTAPFFQQILQRKFYF